MLLSVGDFLEKCHFRGGSFVKANSITFRLNLLLAETEKYSLLKSTKTAKSHC